MPGDLSEDAWQLVASNRETLEAVALFLLATTHGIGRRREQEKDAV
jgi:hypothetical protein